MFDFGSSNKEYKNKFGNNQLGEESNAIFAPGVSGLKFLGSRVALFGENDLAKRSLSELKESAVLEVLCGNDAVGKLSCARFKKAWCNLYARCPWATEFQSWEFLCTWFDVFAERYEPILIVKIAADEQMSGLLALARHRPSGRIVVAGGGHAEYHGWLATETNGNSFIAEALARIAGDCTFPLQFVNVLGCVPTEWLTAPGELKSRCATKFESRPLIDICDRAAIEGVLRKKSNKSRLNRLKRQGDVKFRELSDYREFENCFDDIAEIFDRRQKIHNGITLFHDPLNGRFLLEYAKRYPEQIRVFTLTLDGVIIAALIGQICSDALAIDIIAFDTKYQEFSPAKFLIYMVAREFSESHIRYIDLTPGGEWKTRFQTNTKPATTITVFFSYFDAAVALGMASMKATAKQALNLYKRLLQH